MIKPLNFQKRWSAVILIYPKPKECVPVLLLSATSLTGGVWLLAFNRTLIILLETWAWETVVLVRPLAVVWTIKQSPGRCWHVLVTLTRWAVGLDNITAFYLPDNCGSWPISRYFLFMWWRAIWKQCGGFLVWAYGCTTSSALRPASDTEHCCWVRAFLTYMIYLQADKK